MEKIKSFLESSGGKDILVVFIVILVGLSSFEVGRLSKDSSSAGIKVSYSDQQASAVAALQSGLESTPTTTSIKAIKEPAVSISKIVPKESTVKSTVPPAVPAHVGKSFFASNRGHKYYPLDCSAGKTIKQENRIYFSTKAEAEKAGYELSSSCD